MRSMTNGCKIRLDLEGMCKIDRHVHSIKSDGYRA